MKLAEVKKKEPKIGLDDLFNALEEHAFQVNYDDFEDNEDGTATASWSAPSGGGDIKFTVMGSGIKVEVRGEGENGREEEETLGTYPWQPAKDMAEAIDESMGRFAHDLEEDEDD